MTYGIYHCFGLFKCCCVVVEIEDGMEGENFISTGFVPQMKFPRKIYVTSVNIYETLNAGAVVRISAKSPNDQWVEIFWTPQALHIKRARKFSPRIKVFLFGILFFVLCKHHWYCVLRNLNYFVISTNCTCTSNDLNSIDFYPGVRHGPVYLNSKFIEWKLDPLD